MSQDPKSTKRAEQETDEEIDLGVRSVTHMRVRSEVKAGIHGGDFNSFHGSDFNSAKNANNGEGWRY